MTCEELEELLAGERTCEEGPEGARVWTHCLYPSADPVQVVVSRWGDGFRVTDGGGAVRSALVHGRSLSGMFSSACARHAVEERDGFVIAQSPNAEWLWPAIMAVANASAMAARTAEMFEEQRNEDDLKDQILDALSRAIARHRIAKDYEYRGRSHRMWRMDFAVTGATMILVKAVRPSHNSITSNYTAFGDIGDDDTLTKFSVYDDQLTQDTTALLQQVATIVPVRSLTAMTQRIEERFIPKLR